LPSRNHGLGHGPCRRIGATLLTDDIETGAHVKQGLAPGVTLSQGCVCQSRPTDRAVPSRRRVPVVEAPPTPTPTPFDLADRSPDVRIGRKGLLLANSGHIEDQGLAHGAQGKPSESFGDANDEDGRVIGWWAVPECFHRVHHRS
jgi:hypothetical protein